MMEIVIPLCIEPEPAHIAWRYESSVILIAFRDEVDPPSLALCLAVNRVRKLCKEWPGSGVGDRVNGVKPKCIDVEICDPKKSVLDEIPPYLIASGFVEIDGFAPWCAVEIGEIRTEPGEIVALGTKMVVNNVEHNSQFSLMTRVDESLQAQRSAIGLLHSERKDAVVTPIARAGELGDWHQFDGGDAQIPQLRKARDNRVKPPLVRERAHVKFVENVVAQFNRAPVFIMPFEEWRYDLRRSMNSLRLEPRGGVG